MTGAFSFARFFFFFFYIKSSYFCSFKWPYFGQRIAVDLRYFSNSQFFTVAALNVKIVYYIRFPPTDTAGYWDKSLISTLECLELLGSNK